METFNVTLAGVGGQGILLTANMLAKAAALSGLDVKKSEIHGMAQRGGSVASSVRFGDKVASPIIPVGGTDLLVAFDKLEALRNASLIKAGGKVLVNDVYLTPVTVSSGQQAELADLAGSLTKSLPQAIYVDAPAIAQELGNDRTANMVLAGALSALVPFAEDVWEKALADTFTGNKAKLLDLNRKAFARGRAAVLAK